MGGQPALDGRGLVGRIVVADQVDVEVGRDLGVQLAQELAELAGPVASVQRPDHLAAGHVEGGEQRGGAGPDVVVSSPLGHPGIIGSTGAVRFSAWIWLFSSTHSTSARSGGSRYSPTTSRTLSTNSGSLLSLKVFTRCGLSWKPRQIRPTVDRDSPLSAAIEARDQCVASLGARSKVATTTASICASSIRRGPPGLGSSASPANRCATNRARHLPTVAGTTPSRAATCLLSRPSAQAHTICPRTTRPCADVARRDHRSSCSRSNSSNTNGAFGRPVLATNPSYDLHHEFPTQDTRGAGRPACGRSGCRRPARSGPGRRTRRRAERHCAPRDRPDRASG